MTWTKCRKKPIVVEFRKVRPEGEVIYTREGSLRAYPDKDYIIKGVDGELYPIKRDIFEKTYEVDNMSGHDCSGNCRVIIFEEKFGAYICEQCFRVFTTEFIGRLELKERVT